MRNIISIMLMITSVIAVSSCEKNGTEKPYVKVEDVEYDGNNLTFKLSSRNADYLEYSVNRMEDPRGESKRLEFSQEQKVVVNNVEPDELYVINARAFSSSGTAEDAYVVETVYSSVDYLKKILICKFTGTWCGYCPQMTQVLDQIGKEGKYDFIVAAFHGGDDLETSATGQLESEFYVSGYPTAVIDYRYTSFQKKIQLEDSFEKTLTDNKAVCGISIVSRAEQNRISFDATIEFGAKGNYKICALVMEDNVMNNETIGSLDGSGIYNDVVRCVLTKVEGDELGEMSAGFEKTVPFATEIQSGWNKDNMSIVVYVLKESKTGKYYVTNANVCKVGASVEMATEE